MYVMLDARGCAECSRWCCPENEVVKMNNFKLLLMSSQTEVPAPHCDHILAVMVSAKYGNRLNGSMLEERRHGSP